MFGLVPVLMELQEQFQSLPVAVLVEHTLELRTHVHCFVLSEEVSALEVEFRILFQEISEHFRFVPHDCSVYWRDILPAPMFLIRSLFH